MKDEDIMPFGKYKGEKMANVPPSYLLWLYENDKAGQGSVYNYIVANLSVIKEEIKQEARKKK